MSLEFLSPSPGAPARSPMERQALAAGAQLERRDGWNVAVRFDGEEQRLPTVGFADLSHLRKVELQGELEPAELGKAARVDEGWWCPYSAARAIVLGDVGEERFNGLSVLDVTTVFAAAGRRGPAGARAVRALHRARPARRGLPGAARSCPARWRARRERSCARARRAG